MSEARMPQTRKIHLALQSWLYPENLIRRVETKRRISDSSASDSITDMFSIKRCLSGSRSTCSFVNRRIFRSTPSIKFILKCKTHSELDVKHLQ